MSFLHRFAITLCCGLWVPAFAGTTVDGRTYEIHLPNDQAPKDPAALVIVLHGGGGKPGAIERLTGMSAKSDKEGFIAVYPNGTAGRAKSQVLTWNAWRCCGAAMDKKVDDVAFMRAVVDDVAKHYPVDRKRVYAAGFSNGGMMAYRLGCEAGDLFAAIAPVAGALNSYDCTSGPKVSVVAVHGTADQHVLFLGGLPNVKFDPHNRADNGVAYAMQSWRRRDVCDQDGIQKRQGNVVHSAWKCKEATAVELYAVDGGGHDWPDFATNAIWDFFRSHPKP